MLESAMDCCSSRRPCSRFRTNLRCSSACGSLSGRSVVPLIATVQYLRVGPSPHVCRKTSSYRSSVLDLEGRSRRWSLRRWLVICLMLMV